MLSVTLQVCFPTEGDLTMRWKKVSVTWTRTLRATLLKLWSRVASVFDRSEMCFLYKRTLFHVPLRYHYQLNIHQINVTELYKSYIQYFHLETKLQFSSTGNCQNISKWCIQFIYPGCFTYSGSEQVRLRMTGLHIELISSSLLQG